MMINIPGMKKEYHKEYNKTDKFKNYQKEYYDRPCIYNGETVRFATLVARLRYQGIPNPTEEAKKYLINKEERKRNPPRNKKWNDGIFYKMMYFCGATN